MNTVEEGRQQELRTFYFRVLHNMDISAFPSNVVWLSLVEMRFQVEFPSVENDSEVVSFSQKDEFHQS